MYNGLVELHDFNKKTETRDAAKTSSSINTSSSIRLHLSTRLLPSVFIRSLRLYTRHPNPSLALLRMQKTAFRHMPSASTAGGERCPVRAMMLRSEKIQSLESNNVEFSGGVCGGVEMP
jgi:hypothetical protein